MAGLKEGVRSQESEYRSQEPGDRRQETAWKPENGKSKLGRKIGTGKPKLEIGNPR
jgi:hypothetical protein